MNSTILTRLRRLAEPGVTGFRLTVVTLLVSLPAVTGHAQSALRTLAPDKLESLWVLASRVDPVYPGKAYENGTGGEVRIAFTIDSTGAPVDFETVYSVPRGVFDDAVLAALNQWRYRTSAANPDATPVRTSVTLSFQPDDLRPARTRTGEFEFPSDPAAAGKNGWVRLAYDISRTGVVDNVVVLESNPAGLFDTAALHSVRTRRYAPVVVGGRAIPIRGQIDTVRFYGDTETMMRDCILADPANASPFEISDTSNGPCPARATGRLLFLSLDYEGAAQVLEPLAKAGDPEAALLMGAMYDPGFHRINTRRTYMDAFFNVGEAIRWYRVGVDAGDPYCTMHLMNMDKAAAGVLPAAQRPEYLFTQWGYQPRVLDRWSRTALKFRVENGDAVAAFHYAMTMLFEPSGSHWLQVARDMLEDRAKQGSGVHQWYAGRAFLVGPHEGLKEDFPRAFAWFSVAAKNGVEHARGYQYAVAGQLRTRQRERAEDLAREFVDQYGPRR